MPEPTDEEGVAGFLPVRLGRTKYYVPALSIALSRAWKAHLWQVMADIKGAAPSDEIVAMAQSPDAAEELQAKAFSLDEMTVERGIDLILEYDVENVLGGRAAIEVLASPRDVRRAIESMKDECFPFVEEMTLMNMIQIVAARSRPPSSTNGLSPIGVLPRDHSKRRSRIGSSASSGKPARSA